MRQGMVLIAMLGVMAVISFVIGRAQRRVIQRESDQTATTLVNQ